MGTTLPEDCLDIGGGIPEKKESLKPFKLEDLPGLSSSILYWILRSFYPSDEAGAMRAQVVW